MDCDAKLREREKIYIYLYFKVIIKQIKKLLL